MARWSSIAYIPELFLKQKSPCTLLIHISTSFISSTWPSRLRSALKHASTYSTDSRLPSSRRNELHITTNYLLSLLDPSPPAALRPLLLFLFNLLVVLRTEPPFEVPGLLNDWIGAGAMIGSAPMGVCCWFRSDGSSDPWLNGNNGGNPCGNEVKGGQQAKGGALGGGWNTGAKLRRGFTSKTLDLSTNVGTEFWNDPPSITTTKRKQ